MFQLFDSFRCYDDNLQPYCFSVERHTETDNLHAGAHEDGFHLKSIGNRHILNTPSCKTFTFSTTFRFNYMQEFDPCFNILFQYDPTIRRGYGLRLKYVLSGSLEVSLVLVHDTLVETLDRRVLNGISIGELEWVKLTLEKRLDAIVCTVAEQDITFDFESTSGVLALERENFIGELILKNVCFKTEEEFETKTLLPKVSVNIPCVNGGDIPYRVSWQVTEVDKELYLECSLDGGTKTRPVNREDRMGQYVAEKDTMTDPYVGIRTDGADQIFNLLKGENVFIDPNIYWDCQKDFFHDTEIPVLGTFRLPICTISDNVELIFGYENLICSGYGGQEGGHEFRFDIAGNLCYSGDPIDGRDQWEILSPFDKFALSLIPENCYHREDVVEHLKYNHYFEVSEKICFKLEFRTKTNPEFLSVQAKLVNVFETQTLETAQPTVNVTAWRDGYQCLEADVAFGTLDVGVYKIAFDVCFGSKPYQHLVKVFEVFNKDTDEVPALKSGLPFTFSMPNEQKWLMRNSFDLWSPAKSCDVEHFITCVMDTPIEAMTRRPWEIIKSFKRELFVWVGRRTANDYASEKYAEIRKHADYLFYGIEDGTDDWLSSGSIFPFQAGDFWEYNRINLPFQRGLLKEFIRQHSGSAEAIGYGGDEAEVSRDVFVELQKQYGKPWMKYVTDAIMEIFHKQNLELAQENPTVRRSMYGPVSPYPSPTYSYHTGAFFGFPEDERLSEEVYTGFSIFEDYPYSCAYQTYRGPFIAAGVLLHAPKLRLYPEQYGGSKGGCIDGAVKFAHAPMGAYHLDAYQNSTLANEYVFNTAHRLKDGYHYWSSHGFHRSNCNDSFMNKMIMDWRYAVENKPAKPMRTMAIVADYSTEDDRFDHYRIAEEDWYYWTNRSELGSGLIHECGRDIGLPNCFVLKFDALPLLSADECDLLVLPSLYGASTETLEAIRKLYEQGVNLIALSDISGLEDIFGVRHEKTAELLVNSVSYNGNTEFVFPMTVDLKYSQNGADAIALLNGEYPAVLRTARTALINTDLRALGCSDTRKLSHDSLGNHFTGKLVRKILADILQSMSSPLVQGKNVGVTLFETQSGKTELLVIDYTPFDNQEHTSKEAVVTISLPNVVNAKSDRELFVGKKDGHVKELRFNIRPHESVFIELCSHE